MVDPVIDRTTKGDQPRPRAVISAVLAPPLLAKYCHGGLSGRSTRYNKVTGRLHWDPVSDSGPILKTGRRNPAARGQARSGTGSFPAPPACMTKKLTT